MKKEDKKVPDSPYRLFVYPFHTGLTSGWIDQEGKQHAGFPVCHGMDARKSRYDEEYINLGRVWHSVEEEPEDKEALILLLNADFENPSPYYLDILSTFYDEDAELWEEATTGFQGGYWAYIKDIVPTKLKKGGK